MQRVAYLSCECLLYREPWQRRQNPERNLKPERMKSCNHLLSQPKPSSWLTGKRKLVTVKSTHTLFLANREAPPALKAPGQGSGAGRERCPEVQLHTRQHRATRKPAVLKSKRAPRTWRAFNRLRARSGPAERSGVPGPSRARRGRAAAPGLLTGERALAAASSDMVISER